MVALPGPSSWQKGPKISKQFFESKIQKQESQKHECQKCQKWQKWHFSENSPKISKKLLKNRNFLTKSEKTLTRVVK